MTSPRYALYAVPAADHPLWPLAAAWLGRDPETTADRRPDLPDWLEPERWRAITAEPRRYGFHGTLKPPFILAPGCTAAALADAVATFAAAVVPPGPVPLVVAALSGFLALVPDGAAPHVTTLADRCVEAFDAFRARPTEAELARRRLARLSPVQEAHLQRWGYPYVFDQFRYHMTLTVRLDDVERRPLEAWLGTHFAGALAVPVALQLALFEQPNPTLPFRLAARYPMGG